MKKIITLSLVISSALFGAGHQIPNTSINSSALATANVANANGADSAYYNPANMIYNDDEHEIEASLTYVSLTPINYKATDGSANIDSKMVDSFIPNIHYVSKKLNDKGVRVGFSIVVPAGLSRAWDDTPAINSAKLYALQTIEFNPSFAIPLNSKTSLAFGFRYLKASGEVEVGANASTLKMEGSGQAFGYNLALSHKIIESLNLSATYRSAVIIKLDGDSTSKALNKSGDASLNVPIPANLILAAAYSFNADTTLEITYDKTMWSVVQETDFNFEDPTMEAVLGGTKAKKWHDTQAYRIGLTHKLDSITAMAGFAYSTNAADDRYVSFSSPESDSLTFSLGGRYKINSSVDVGLATLYSQNKERTVANGTVDGKLSNKSVYSITAGASYKF